MSSVETCLEQGERLVALTPTRLGPALAQALAAVEASASATDSLVVCADLGDLDTRSTGRMAAILGEPGRGARLVAEAYGCTERDGLVLASRSFAHALDAARERKAAVFREADFRAAPEATLSRLLRRLDMEPDPVALEGITRTFADAVRAIDAEAASEATSSAFDRALDFYATPERGSAPSAWWDRGLFHWGDRPQETCPPSMDVTGLPRTLAFGPYVTLTPGLWRADVVFDVCEHAARRSYRIDFGSDDGFSHENVGPVKAGRNLISVSHRFDAAVPAWVRVVVARAAFHGDMRFVGATITALDPDFISVEAAPVQTVDVRG